MDRVGPPLLQLSRTQQLQPSLLELLEQLIVDVKASSIANGSTDNIAAADNNSDDDDDDALGFDDYNNNNFYDYNADDASTDATDDHYTRRYHWSLHGASREMKNKQRHQRRLAVLECLLRKEHLPLRQRNLIDDFVDKFHENINSDIHHMITNQRDANTFPAGTLIGLDIGRDTHAEVETILRIFPDQIKQGRVTSSIYRDGRWVEIEYEEDGDYPIQCLPLFWDRYGNEVSDTNAIPFIHVFAKLAIEFNSFKKVERGGLSIEDVTNQYTVIENLSRAKFTATYDSEDCGFLDEVRATEFNRLRQMGLMVVDDIREYYYFMTPDDIREYYYILVLLCEHDIFPENSARFLIEWYPECLIKPSFNDRGMCHTPLFTVAWLGSLQSFRFIFEYLIRYYPYKKGISQLFQRRRRWPNHDGKTPLQVACGTRCNPLKRKKYMDVVEEVLSQYSGSTPINTMDAIIAAAIDPSIHVEGVYFLMRRQPDALISMIKSTSRSTTTGVLKNDDSHHHHHGRNTNNNTSKNRRRVYGSSRRDNDRDNNDRNDDNVIHNTTKKGKRKRK